MEFTNEKAVDSDSVSSEAYSAFWEDFLEQCEGEDEPDYQTSRPECKGSYTCSSSTDTVIALFLQIYIYLYIAGR